MIFSFHNKGYRLYKSNSFKNILSIIYGRIQSRLLQYLAPFMGITSYLLTVFLCYMTELRINNKRPNKIKNNKMDTLKSVEIYAYFK